jgi:hypothetical protein
VGPRCSLDDVEKGKFLTVPGIELRPLCHPAHRIYLSDAQDSSSVVLTGIFFSFSSFFFVPFVIMTSSSLTHSLDAPSVLGAYRKILLSARGVSFRFPWSVFGAEQKSETIVLVPC